MWGRMRQWTLDVVPRRTSSIQKHRLKCVHTRLWAAFDELLPEGSLAVGVDRMQRNFGPLKQRVEEWQAMQLSTASAKLLIYQAFIEDELGFPKHLARRVHELYFQPVHQEFQARTMWSLSNAFTSAFKELEPIPQYKATAKLAGFLQSVRPQ